MFPGLAVPSYNQFQGYGPDPPDNFGAATEAYEQTVTMADAAGQTADPLSQNTHFGRAAMAHTNMINAYISEIQNLRA